MRGINIRSPAVLVESRDERPVRGVDCLRPGEGETHRIAYLVERMLKSLMPLEYHGLLHPLTGLGRVAKEPSRCGGLLADQISHRKCPL